MIQRFAGARTWQRPAGLLLAAGSPYFTCGLLDTRFVQKVGVPKLEHQQRPKLLVMTGNAFFMLPDELLDVIGLK